MMSNAVIVTSLIAFASLLSVSNRVAQAGPLHHTTNTKITTIAQSAIINTSEPHALVRKRREIYPEIIDDQPISQEKVAEDQSQQVCVVGDLVYEADESVPAEQPCLKCRCQPPGVLCETTRCEKKPGCRAIHKPNTCCPEYQCECEYEGRTYANGERLEQQPGTECKVCYCRGGEVQCAEVSCYIRNDCEGRHVPGKCCPKYDHCPPKEPSNIFFANEINETNKQIIKVRDDHYHNQHPIQPQPQKPSAEQEVEEAHQEITIHEIIPEIKEIPITNSPKREINKVMHKQILQSTQNTLSIEEKLPTNKHLENRDNVENSENDVNTPDADLDGSEVAEIYQHPPSVLRIGDKLLFLKKDGELVQEKGVSIPSAVITIIGAEGLQRGGVEVDVEEEHHDIKSNVESTTWNNDDDDNEDIQTVAASTYILSLLKKPSTISTTTEQALEDFNTTENSFDDLYVRNFTDGNISENSTDYNYTTPDPEIYSSSVSTSTPETLASSSSTILLNEKEEIIETNPEYPPIPDVMTQQVEESEPVAIADAKILREVFDLQPLNNATQNASAGTWLKKTLLNPAAALPESILNSRAESDFNSTSVGTTAMGASEEITTTLGVSETFTAASTTNIENIGSSSGERSKETMESTEVLDSGENVTPTNDHASILNEESNASVEDVAGTLSASMEADGGTAELVEMLPGFANLTTVESIEAGKADSDTPAITPSDDVEMIDVDLMRGHSSDDLAKNSTHEGQQPYEKIPEKETVTKIEEPSHNIKKLIEKRESNEDESIFEELNREIGLDSGTIVDEVSSMDSEEEAKQIFKELVDEAKSGTTAKPVNLQGTSIPQTREQQQQAMALARIGDALAKLQLKGGADTNVLGILRDFFTAQYRAYN